MKTELIYKLIEEGHYNEAAISITIGLLSEGDNPDVDLVYKSYRNHCKNRGGRLTLKRRLSKWFKYYGYSGKVTYTARKTF